MAQKQFREISVGTQFELGGLKYQKINEERISCCKALNAVQLVDNKIDNTKKIQVLPLDQVTIPDQQ